MALGSLLPVVASHARPLTDLDRLVFEAAPSTGHARFAGAGKAAEPGTGRKDLAAGTERQLEALAESIGSSDADAAPDSAGRYRDLMRLGSLYQLRGEHLQALAAFARARYVSRRDTGFYSLDQIDALDRSLPSLVATGRLHAADRGYEKLVRLTKNHYGADATEVVPALIELGDFKLDAFNRAVRGGPSPETEVPVQTFGIKLSSPTETESRSNAFELLRAAQSAYVEAIQRLVAHERFRDARLRQLELKLVETYFLQAYRRNIIENPVEYMASRRLEAKSIAGQFGVRPDPRRFGYGEAAYQRILGYLEHDPDATAEEFGRTLVGLGDWYMLFGHRSDALATYRKALEALESGGATRETIARLLRPDVPVRLPTFVAAPHSPGEFGAAAPERAAAGGFIDVRFTLNRYGRAQDVEVTGGSASRNKAVRGRLVWMLRDAQFRPLFDDGTPVDGAPISIRYTVSETGGE